jgi:hypothetical protein
MTEQGKKLIRFNQCECSMKDFCRMFGQYPECDEIVPDYPEHPAAGEHSIRDIKAYPKPYEDRIRSRALDDAMQAVDQIAIIYGVDNQLREHLTKAIEQLKQHKGGVTE